MQRTDVYLLAGFLGAGKTTLLKRLLAHPWKGKSAVVVNEFGAVGIDGNEVREGSGYDVVEITSGCVCCTLRGRFLESFRTLLGDVEPARIFVEASGVSEPSQILKPLRSPELAERLARVSVVTVVDATFFPKREVLGGFYEGQIAEAQVTILNKIDQVQPEQHEKLREELRSLNPAAHLLTTVHCEVDLEHLLALMSDDVCVGGDPGGGENDSAKCEKPQFLSFSLETEGVIPLEKLKSFITRNADQILRAKGWVRTERGMSTLNWSSHGLELQPRSGVSCSTQLAFVLLEQADCASLQIELMGEFSDGAEA